MKDASEFVVADAHRYDRRSPVRWVLSHLFRYPLWLGGFVGLTILGSVASSLLPRLTGVAFDVVQGTSELDWSLLALAGALLGVALLQGLTQLGSSFTIEVVGQRLERDARDELYTSLLGKSQTFHDRQRVGDIMARAANDVRQLNPMMNPGVSLITRSAMSTVVPIVFIGFLDVRLLAAPLLFVVAFGFALRRYMARLNPVSGAQRRQFGVMNAGLTEAISGIEVVKSTVQEEAARERFLDDARLFRDHYVEQGRIQATYLPLLLIGVAIAGAFAHGLYLLSVDVITLGDLVAYLGLMSVLRFPAFISIFTFMLVQLGLASATRILDLMEQETEIDENAGGHSAPVEGHLVFDDVSFGYGGDDGKQVLHDVSFEARPGRAVAIVGQTGSGKSTLTRLINRTYDVGSGHITIDGVDVRDWDLQSLRPQISVIEQDVFLFSRSIHDNIAFGLAEGATREVVIEAAKAAQAHDFILGFKEGYDTVIGERGVTLSGGQRQRLAIARALLTDPRILILDDATSAVDSATEDRIQRAIDAVLEGRTTFLITHRLSQIRRADHILVLDHGEVIDQGTHAELLDRCAPYQRIFGRREVA